MTTQDIEVNVNDVQITSYVNDIQIIVNVTSVATIVPHVSSDSKFYFDGAGGDTYLMYNSTTSRLEVWVNGVKQKEFGSYSGSNPFG